MDKHVELEADEVAVYTVQEDGSLTSLSEKYPLVDPHLYAPITVLVDMKLTRGQLIARLERLAAWLREKPGLLFVSEPRPEPFHIEL